MKKLFSVLMLGIVLSASAQTDVSTSYQNALNYIQKGNNSSAIKALSRVIMHDKDYENALLLRAESKYKMSAYKSARVDVIDHIKYHGVNEKALTLLANIDYRLDNVDTALPTHLILDRLFSSNKDKKKKEIVNERIGDFYLAQKEKDKACEHWAIANTNTSSKKRTQFCAEEKLISSKTEEVKKKKEVKPEKEKSESTIRVVPIEEKVKKKETKKTQKERDENDYDEMQVMEAEILKAKRELAEKEARLKKEREAKKAKELKAKEAAEKAKRRAAESEAEKAQAERARLEKEAKIQREKAKEAERKLREARKAEEEAARKVNKETSGKTSTKRNTDNRYKTDGRTSDINTDRDGNVGSKPREESRKKEVVIPEDDGTVNRIKIDDELTLEILGGGLGSRKVIEKPNILILSEKDGSVALNVIVNRQGKVISAKFNEEYSTIKTTHLLSLSVRKSREFIFESSTQEEQQGIIIFHIKAS